MKYPRCDDYITPKQTCSDCEMYYVCWAEMPRLDQKGWLEQIADGEVEKNVS